MRTVLKVAALALVCGVGLQTFVADAGWRHFRVFRSCAAPSCAGSSCSAPMYVVAPPANCSCGAPVWGCSGPACSGPGCFGGGCFGPSCSGCFGPSCSGCFGPACSGPGYYGGYSTGYNAGYSFGGYGSTYDFGPQAYSSFGTQPAYGAAGYGGAGYPQVSFGGAGVGAGFGYGVPSYYAPVPSQYTPVPPAPASDLVW